MADQLTVVRVYPLTTSRRLGIETGDALLSRGGTVRFRVLSRDPPAVRTIGSHPEGAAVAIESWLAEQRPTEGV